MSGVDFLEEFTGTRPDDPAEGGGIAPEEFETEKRAAYEQGYSAGWDDALRAEAETHNRITSEFANNLQDLGFTFHEARSHVMRSMEPFLTELVQKFIPALAAEAMGPMIIETLLERASTAADAPIDLTVPVGMAEHLEPLIADIQTVPVRVIEEESLPPGQAFLRTSKRETRIDLTDATDRICRALADMYDINHRSEANG